MVVSLPELQKSNGIPLSSRSDHFDCRKCAGLAYHKTQISHRIPMMVQISKAIDRLEKLV